MIKLLLLSDLLGDPDRKLFKGLVRYANEKGGWRLYSVSTSVSDDPGQCQAILEKAKALGVDAIFGQWVGINEELVKKEGIPVILRTYTEKHREFPMLFGDYYSLGRMGGEFFKKKNYASYAFIGIRGLFWSDERLRGFKDVVKDGRSDFSFIQTSNFDNEREMVGKWLEGLPKPVALLACNDITARKVCEVCQDLALKIPEEISILGIDNSDFLCNFSYPTISSIQLDFEKQGYELATVIDRIVQEKKVEPYRISIEPMKIIERDSTMRHFIKDPVVKRIIDYIDLHFAENISVKDIIKDIYLSRRVIEMRFKKEMKPFTILSYLTSVRIENMCRLLETTKMSVYETAFISGFSNPLNVSRSFKSLKGCSPTEWRKRCCSSAD